MTRLPDIVFVADPKREAIATKEVNKLGLPMVGLVDTNCDPDEVDYLIPGNDDAIRSCSLIVKTLARAVEEGRQKVQIAEFLAAEEAKQRGEQQGTAPAGEAGSAQARQSRSPRGGARDGRDNRSGQGGGRQGGRSDGAPARGGQQGRRPRPAAAQPAPKPAEPKVEAVEPPAAGTEQSEA